LPVELFDIITEKIIQVGISTTERLALG